MMRVEWALCVKMRPQKGDLFLSLLCVLAPLAHTMRAEHPQKNQHVPEQFFNAASSGFVENHPLGAMLESSPLPHCWRRILRAAALIWGPQRWGFNQFHSIQISRICFSKNGGSIVGRLIFNIAMISAQFKRK
jgi:hypothetical protein